jgi:hypothetical protein
VQGKRGSQRIAVHQNRAVPGTHQRIDRVKQSQSIGLEAGLGRTSGKPAATTITHPDHSAPGSEMRFEQIRITRKITGVSHEKQDNRRCRTVAHVQVSRQVPCPRNRKPHFGETGGLERCGGRERIDRVPMQRAKTGGVDQDQRQQARQDKPAHVGHAANLAVSAPTTGAGTNFDTSPPSRAISLTSLEAIA